MLFIKLRIGGVLLAALLTLLAVGGCGQQENPTSNSAVGRTDMTGTAYPLQIVDDLGTNVVIDAEPRRLVSLSPSNTEILFALGLGNRVVGVTEWCDYPAEAANKPKIGDLNGNLEKILATRPDLVLASGSLNRNMVDRLRQAGLQVLALEPQSVEGVFQSLMMVGKATNTMERAQAIVADQRRRIAAVQEKLQTISDNQLRVFIEVDYPLYTAGRGSYVDDLVRLAGGKNVVENLTFYAPQSEEAVISLNPDVILALDYYYLSPDQKVERRPAWDAIKAVKENRIVTDMQLANVLNRPGPRAAEAVEGLARAFYPERFR